MNWLLFLNSNQKFLMFSAFISLKECRFRRGQLGLKHRVAYFIRAAELKSRFLIMQIDRNLYHLVKQELSTQRSVVVKMSNISNYIISDDLTGYDEKLNPRRLSTFELLPNKVSWSCGDVNVEVMDDNKIIPLLLRCNSEVAVIKAPFDKNENQAYIFDSLGNVKWNLRGKIPCSIHDAMFSDVYYINEVLCFFISKNNGVYRFSFNSGTGLTGDLIPSY
ncbi:hypothetical protein C3Z09_09410 [Lelliottia aquatilis]|nr:hypothetical protein C3Z09_09410 [Lelliottia aquatilis]